MEYSIKEMSEKQDYQFQPYVFMIRKGYFLILKENHQIIVLLLILSLML